MFFRRFHRRRYLKCFGCVFLAFIFWSIVGYLYSSTDEDFPEDVMYDIFIDETKDDHEHIPLDQEMMEELQRLKDKKKYEKEDIEDPKDPIVMWWTEFTGEPGRARSCGEGKCFFTNNRKYRTHENMKAFMFYGTDFSPKDLPLPRKDHHEWALFHEESPKNNFLLCHEDALSLFNYTSTFRRESDFPITTQHLMSLDWLEQRTYTKSTSQKNRYQEQESLAPIVFVQSDCDPPSDRDEFVKTLMKFIPVDSYGTCLNNKKLPHKINAPLEGMAHKDFYEILSHYKFALAMENAVCDDYITEKLWRPLMVGTVPIVFGSPKVKDLLPSNDSAIIISDFKSAEQLASHIKHLNRKDFKYDKLRLWKETGVTNTNLRDIMFQRSWAPDDGENWEPGHVNFVEGFECYVCEQIHEKMTALSKGKRPIHHWANVNHYGCPKPLKFDDLGRYRKEGGWMEFWSTQWERQKETSHALKECIEKKNPYCGDYKTSDKLKNDF